MVLLGNGVVYPQIFIVEVPENLPEHMDWSLYHQPVPCISDKCNTELSQFKNLLAQNGYLKSNFKVRNEADTFYVTTKIGPRYYWKEIKYSNVPPDVQNKIPEAHFINKFYSQTELDKLNEQIVVFYEENGFPFASVGLEDIDVTSETIAATVTADPGPMVFYGGLEINGGPKIRTLWLQKLLKVREGEKYEQSVVDAVEKKLDRIGLIPKKIHEIQFEDSLAKISMILPDSKPSSFDGALGFLMNGEGNRPALAGFVDLSLGNVLNTWKKFDVSWQKTGPHVQELKTDLFYPAFVLPDINFSMRFNLFKSDTTFINIRAEAEIRLPVLKNIDLILKEEYHKGNSLQGPDASDLAGNFKMAYHGVGLAGKMDGFNFNLGSSVGNKLLDTARAELKGLPHKSIQMKSWVMFNYLHPLFGGWKIYSILEGGAVTGPGLVYNDLFRLGGLKSIRGYNTWSLEASEYVQFSLEPRYYFNNGAFFSLFSDFGLINNALNGQKQFNWPFCLGGGLVLPVGTSARFNFLVAMNKEAIKRFEILNSKVHFGYLVNF